MSEGQRDIAAFLTVPKAIEFQAKHNWDKVRAACHELAKDPQKRVCDMGGLSPLHPQSERWFAQMVTAPLPAEIDISSLKPRLYDDYRIEIPVSAWKEKNNQDFNSRL